jgi:hypothetical protein
MTPDHDLLITARSTVGSAVVIPQRGGHDASVYKT